MGRRVIQMSEVLEVIYQWLHGTPQRKISRSLGISRNTVKSIIEQAKKLGLSLRETDEQKLMQMSEQITKLRTSRASAVRQVDVKLKDWHEQIEAWLEIPSMTVKQIWRLLSEKNPPVCIGINSLHRYIHRNFTKMPSVTMTIPTIAGSQAQVDFGYVGLMKDPSRNKYRKAYVFIMTLSHSRHRFVYFVFRQDSRTWIDCHWRAFVFFGGIPQTILLDNLKAGVLKPDIYDPIINRAYSEFERHCGFIADPAKVRTPEHKGKVERSVTIIKQQVIAGREFKDIHDANQYARHWALEEIANRITRTTGETPKERFLRDEKHKLLPLPETLFECPIWSDVIVGRDQHVCFLGAFYSIPEKYIKMKLSVRATTTIVQFYKGSCCVKTHPIAINKGQWLTDLNDLHTSAQFFLKNTPELCMEQAILHGHQTLKLIKMVLEKPSTTRLRKANAILRLAKTYGSSRLEAACCRALFFCSTDYKTIENILEKNLDMQPLTEKQIHSEEELSEGAFLRNANEFTVH